MEHPRKRELPFSGEAVQQLISYADRAFDRRLALMMHPEERALRRLWDAQDYLETWPFVGIPRPIEMELACTLVEVFLPHHIFETLEQLSDRTMRH